MSWVNEALADYGRSIGIDSLTFNEAGVASLKFELLGDLYIEQADAGVLVYLMREIERPSAEIYAAALEVCHWQHNHAYQVNPSLRGERYLILAVNLTEEDFSVPTLEQLLQLLGQLHDQALEGAPA